jgi:hypothetical protein
MLTVQKYTARYVDMQKFPNFFVLFTAFRKLLELHVAELHGIYKGYSESNFPLL